MAPKWWGIGSVSSKAGKLASKISATKFVYTFTVHNLTPWPHVQRAIAIGWQSEHGGPLASQNTRARVLGPRRNY
jgi:hypothetical protein